MDGGDFRANRLIDVEAYEVSLSLGLGQQGGS